jgi:hypothetical protein
MRWLWKVIAVRRILLVWKVSLESKSLAETGEPQPRFAEIPL